MLIYKEKQTLGNYITITDTAGKYDLLVADNNRGNNVPTDLINERNIDKCRFSRFGLGMVQFGMYYGAFNRDGSPSPREISILHYAAEYGISVID